jgi:pyruvate-formate lyase
MFSLIGILRLESIRGATPDGRFAHEMLSKNMTASTGMDRNGVTALITQYPKLIIQKYLTEQFWI